jgi:hypothetical protein
VVLFNSTVVKLVLDFFPHIDAPRQVSTFSGQRLLDAWLTYRGNYPPVHEKLSSIPGSRMSPRFKKIHEKGEPDPKNCLVL